MNPYDKQNLDFIMSISNDPEAMREWYMAIDNLDRLYAAALFEMAIAEEAFNAPEQFSQDLDCTEASQFLAKFTLKGNK